MDSFMLNNLRIEKANAMLRYRRLRHVTKLFRLLELCLALLCFSWTSSRLPFFVKIAGDYFRQLLSLIVSPLFIFIISNLIVLTLFTKSGQLTAKSSDTTLYDDFTRAIENNEPDNCAPVPDKSDEIIYQDKQMICEVNNNDNDNDNDVVIIEPTLVSSDEAVKVYRRSQSENLEKEKIDGNLRRSATDKCMERSGESVAEIVEELSNEEFQRTIEAFIAKQLRFHKEEKLAILLPQPATLAYS